MSNEISAGSSPGDAIKRLSGIARDVRHTINVGAGGSRTDHLALFEIDGVRLCFRGDDPVPIKEGDELAVVWEPGEKGYGTVLAFHNRTLDVRDHDVRPTGCTGCGCSTFILGAFMAATAVYAGLERDWDRLAIAIVILVLLWMVHRIGQITERKTAEKQRQVDELLDSA